MQSLMAMSDLEVDTIIEKVMIRNTSHPYNYAPHPPHQLTPNQHLWHFRLQEENLELRTKIKELKSKLKEKANIKVKQEHRETQISIIKDRLQEVLVQNSQLQKELNRFRVRNSRLNDSLRHELQESQKRNKSKRQCSCENLYSQSRSKENRVRKHSPGKQSFSQRSQRKVVTIMDSPVKQILKQQQDVSINCHIPTVSSQNHIKKRKEQIEKLRKIVKNQDSLIESYQEEINNKTKTMSTFQRHPDRKPSESSRYYHLQRPTSTKTFHPLSSAGSIVKVKRN